MQMKWNHAETNLPVQRQRSRPVAFVHIALMAAIIFAFSTTLTGHLGPDVIADTGASSAPSSLYLPQVEGAPKATCERDPTPDVFGVQMYYNSGKTSPYYNALKESGAQWVRVPLEWSLVEPQNTVPSAYDWTSTDRVLGAARDGCFHLIVTHRNAPSWAATNPNSVIDKTSLDELTQFIRAAVERYDGDGFQDAPGSPVINLWEMYNEPDSGTAPTFVGWGKYAEEYADMLEAVYPVIKAANPNAKVVMGGIAHDWFEEDGGPFVRDFMEDILKAGGGDHFDIMNYHSYPPFYQNWADQGPGLLEKAEHLRAMLQKYGHNKPLVVTESGWHSSNHASAPSTPDQQSQYIVELFTQSLAANIDFMIYWMLYDPGPYHPHESGLVTESNPPVKKPAFDAFRTTVDKLADTNFLNRLSDSETRSDEMEAYRFDAPSRNQTVYVAWIDPITSAQVETLRLPGEQATVTSMYGAISLVSDNDDGDNDGHIKVSVGAKPLFIEVPK